jgi:F-type H+-transporting ATPase subunit delta
MTAFSPEILSLEGRYAKTLFDSLSSLEEAQMVFKEMTQLLNIIETHEDFSLLLHRPLLSREEVCTLLENVMTSLSFSDLFKKFIDLLARRKRLSELKAITSAFEDLILRGLGQKYIVIFSATPLDKPKETHLIDILKKTFGEKLLVDFEIDSDLISGIKIHAQNIIIDASLASQLNQLHKTLI